MSVNKIIKVGVDFDGVVAYNPLRIFRAPIVSVKKNILKKNKVKFFIPETPVQKLFFKLAHEFSLLPSIGTEMLRGLSEEGELETHLVSGRYAYLNPGLYKWLKKHDLDNSFTSINPNELNEQPHLFKKRMVDKLKLDYFIEDNLDIVNYLSARTRARVMWIYNIIDKNNPYTYKYPYLKKALEAIVKNE